MSINPMQSAYDGRAYLNQPICSVDNSTHIGPAAVRLRSISRIPGHCFGSESGRPLDAHHLAYRSDNFPPRTWYLRPEPGPYSTITMSVYFHATGRRSQCRISCSFACQFRDSYADPQ
jgi:Acyl-CoA thioesterase C-terminal domain